MPPTTSAPSATALRISSSPSSKEWMPCWGKATSCRCIWSPTSSRSSVSARTARSCGSQTSTWLRTCWTPLASCQRSTVRTRRLTSSTVSDFTRSPQMAMPSNREPVWFWRGSPTVSTASRWMCGSTRAGVRSEPRRSMTSRASGSGAAIRPSLIPTSTGCAAPGSRAPLNSRSSTVQEAITGLRLPCVSPGRLALRLSICGGRCMAVTSDVEPGVLVREGVYGDRVLAVEPGGNEYIPDSERHGRPLDLFWTWMSPNLEFATIYVGVLPIVLFGGGFWLTALGCILGTALGSLTHGFLSSMGPRFGVPQMVQSRAAFGYRAGWNPYASDYSRYLPRTVSKFNTGLAAGLGVFVSCAVLEIAGAGVATLGGTNPNPTANFTAPLPGILPTLVLIGILVGAIAANVINVYSGAMSFLTLGIKLALHQRRAISAVGSGVIGLILGLAFQANVGPGTKYENFLLAITYWIAPWLAIVFVDYWLRRGQYREAEYFDSRHNPWAGPVAMLLGLLAGIPFWDQGDPLTPGTHPIIGAVPFAHPEWGDLTFFVSFVVAGVLYVVFRRVFRQSAAVAAAA